MSAWEQTTLRGSLLMETVKRKFKAGQILQNLIGKFDSIKQAIHYVFLLLHVYVISNNHTSSPKQSLSGMPSV